MSVTVSTLPNGLRVATDTMTTVETVSLGMWVGVGTRHEREAENGVSHLLEHMAFKGTQRRTAGDIAREIEAVGGFLNAYTAREVTAYYAKVLREDAALAVDILADILTGSVFDGEELERERTVIPAGDRAGAGLPRGRGVRPVPGDRLSRPGDGAQHSRPAGGRPLAAAGSRGRLDGGALQGAGHGAGGGRPYRTRGAAGPGRSAHFADLPTAPAPVPEAARYAGGDVRERRDIEQSHLVLGFEGPSFREAGFYAAQVFSTLYGGGMSSRLFQEVREKRGLVYSIYSFASSAADTGLVGVYAGTASGERGRSARHRGAANWRTWRAGAPERTNSPAPRAQLRASLSMARESTSSRCEQLAQQLLVHNRPIPAEELTERVEAVKRGRCHGHRRPGCARAPSSLVCARALRGGAPRAQGPVAGAPPGAHSNPHEEAGGSGGSR